MHPILLENGVLQVSHENYSPWPHFQPLGSQRIGGLWRAHYLRDILNADDLSCAAWRAPIPASILASLRCFPEAHAELIEMAQDMPEYYLKMVDYSPAMTLLAATYWAFRKPKQVPDMMDRKTLWENLDPEDILNFARFPHSRSFRKTLAKVPAQACFVHRLQNLRELWQVPQKRRLLQHLPIITGETIWLLSCHPPILDPAIHRLAAEQPEYGEYSILELVSDLSNRRELQCLNHWPYRNQIHTWPQLIAAYNRFLFRGNCLPEILPSPPVLGIDDGEIHVVPLQSRTALRQEGKLMANCIEDYVSGISAGDNYAYQMLRPERATILLRRVFSRWEVEEIGLKHNEGQASEKTQELINKWLSSHR